MKTFNRALRAAGFGAFAAAALMSGTASAAIAIGDKLEVQYLFPNVATVYGTSGVFTFTGDGQTVLTQGGITSVIISATSVIFSESPGCGSGCTQSSAAFNGPTLLNLTNASAFTGWGVTSDTVGLTSALLTDGKIGVNWQGSVVRGAATISAVPEPATWALMITGLGLVGAGMRRQRQRTNVSFA